MTVTEDVATGPNFVVRVTHSPPRVVWSGATREADPADARVFAAALLAAADKLDASQRTRNARWRIHRDDLEAWLRGDPS